MANKVDFFKCYNPKTSAQRLELPSAFSLQFKGALPERAYLVDRNANLWLVKMAKIGNDLFFCDGWEKFVQDNSVEARDVFVFRYDGYSLFDVKLLGLTGCDKEGFGETQVEQVTHDKDIKMSNKVDFFKCYNPKTSAKRLELPSAFSLQFKGALPERAYLVDRNANFWLVKMAKIGNDLFFCDGWEKFVQDNSVEAWDVFVFRYDGYSLFDVKLLGLTGCDKECFGETQVEQVTHGRPVQRPLSPYGNDMFRSGLAIRPRNPYFVTKTRKSRPDELYIPKETIKDFQLDNLPEEMFLIDPQDRKFPVKIKRLKDERVWYRGGWKSLCAVNSVSQDDTCICEFVDGSLSIKFVRGNS